MNPSLLDVPLKVVIVNAALLLGQRRAVQVVVGQLKKVVQPVDFGLPSDRLPGHCDLLFHSNLVLDLRAVGTDLHPIDEIQVG